MTADVAQGRIPAWTMADRLRKAREHAGFSQAELGSAIDVSRRSVTNYETGTKTPRRPVLLSWAMATGVPLEWLQDGVTPGPLTSKDALPAGWVFESPRGSHDLYAAA